MKHEVQTKKILTIEFENYKIIFANSKQSNYIEDVISQFTSCFEVIKVIPPKTTVELVKPNIIKQESSTIQIKSTTQPTNRNPNALAIELWNDIKDRLNQTFDIKAYQNACINSGRQKDAEHSTTYNRLNSLVRHKIIKKTRDANGIPVYPLTYTIVNKENPIEFLKNVAKKEANDFRDTAKMS